MKQNTYKKVDQKEPKGKRCLPTLQLKIIQITGQRKAFCKQKTPASSRAKKETVKT